MADDLIRRLAENTCRKCYGAPYIGPIDRVEATLRSTLAPLLADAKAMQSLIALSGKQAVTLENPLGPEWHLTVWGFIDQHGCLAKREYFGSMPTEAIKAAAEGGESNGQ